MKKHSVFLLILIGSLFLTACGHKHTWVEATCTEAKTCSECGETEGEALGHTWKEATCTEPKICTVCGETEGKPLGHKAAPATCTEPSVCSVCGKTVAEASGHDWKEATHSAPKTCKKCGLTEGEPLPTLYFDMSFTEFKNTFNKEYSGKLEIVPVKGSGFYLDLKGGGLSLRGTTNAVLIFNSDEFESTSTAYSTEELEQFNSLMIRYISPSLYFDADYATVICMMGIKFAQILDPTLPDEAFLNGCTSYFGDDYFYMSYSSNGFDYYYSGHDNRIGDIEPTAYWYEFTIMLSDN
ncbi:MAG: hypothetical protein IJ179_00490 [Oscillospiraceae bacterium]|nr:hypothetical protein [Oscillospiraceae bacterium]